MAGNFSAFLEIPRNQYDGQWVVLLNKKVVAHGSAREIKHEVERIRKENPSEIPFVAKVPKKILQIV